MTPSELHYKLAMVIEEKCISKYGTEYERWASEYFRAYAEHLMLALDAMSDDELAKRFQGVPDLHEARDEDLAYWISIVTCNR